MRPITDLSQADVIRNGEGFILESAAEVSMFKCMSQWWGYSVQIGENYLDWGDLYDEVEETLGSRQLFMDSFFWPLPNHDKPIPDVLVSTTVSIKKEKKKENISEQKSEKTKSNQMEMF